MNVWLWCIVCLQDHNKKALNICNYCGRADIPAENDLWCHSWIQKNSIKGREVVSSILFLFLLTEEPNDSASRSIGVYLLKIKHLFS